MIELVCDYSVSVGTSIVLIALSFSRSFGFIKYPTHILAIEPPIAAAQPTAKIGAVEPTKSVTPAPKPMDAIYPTLAVAI